jgi:hypothetical protein
MDEKTARDVRTYGTIGLLIVAVATFLLQAVPSLRSGIPPALLVTVLVATLAIAAGLAIAAFPTAGLVRYFARRTGEKIVPAPPDMTREVLALITTTKKVWLPESMYVDSFSLASRSVLNALLPKSADPAFASSRNFIDQASGLINGVRMHSPVTEIVSSELEGLSKAYGVGMDRDTLIVLLGDILAIALAGANTANGFAQSMSSAGSDLPQYTRDEWGQFADKANRLSEDVAKLGEKIKTTFGDERSYYIPQVRKI